MDKKLFNSKEKYYPISIKNQLRYENNKKLKDTKPKTLKENLFFLSEKKERNSFTLIKTFIDINDEISKEILNKKLIKVNTDNKSKPKNNINNKNWKSNRMINNKPNQTIKSNNKSIDTDISMKQKINKFESRIDTLLNVINDFEEKYINSPQSQKIKEQFDRIINKDIYKNKSTDNSLFKSYNKHSINKNILGKKEENILDINSINNINININNNNYENNYFITQTINDIGNKGFNINSNNSIFKQSNLKRNKKIAKCNSNDLKNKTINNYKNKSKLFKLPLDYINNNLKIKNNRYNNSYKELQLSLTDRKEKNMDDNKKTENIDLKGSLKNFHKKKNSNYMRTNKAASTKNENRKKAFFKKNMNNKMPLIQNKNKIILKVSTPLSVHSSHLSNNIITGGIDMTNKNKDKEKLLYGSSEFTKHKRKEISGIINYILNKRNIIKGSFLKTGGNNQYDKDVVNINRKISHIKKK